LTAEKIALTSESSGSARARVFAAFRHAARPITGLSTFAFHPISSSLSTLRTNVRPIVIIRIVSPIIVDSPKILFLQKFSPIKVIQSSLAANDLIVG
jgi:hypothetical protein